MRDRLLETPSQTAGPYVHIGTAPQSIGRPPLINQPGPVIESNTGEAIIIEGTVLDGAGAPVRDAMLEIWQADGLGRTGEFGLFGRTVADFSSGLFRFQSVRPGAHAQGHAPHVALLIFARGINIHLHTRIYFPQDLEAMEQDSDMKRLEPEARETLIAREAGRNEAGLPVYRFDIRLQGAGETVFFDI